MLFTPEFAALGPWLTAGLLAGIAGLTILGLMHLTTGTVAHERRRAEVTREAARLIDALAERQTEVHVASRENRSRIAA